jgi:hypothetical protein
LHYKKNYKIETLFTAVYTFDQFLMSYGHWEYERENLCLLAVTSLLLAAKFEEPIAPSYERMIRLLTIEEQR